MYKKSKEKADQILSLYKEGKMLTEITQLTSSSQATVKKVLLHFGINYDSDKKENRSDTLNKVLELYQQGKSQIYIEKELNLTRKTIRELLKSKGIEYRDKSQQHHIRYNTQINHNAFDALTPESLYWIGMLYSDGHVETVRESAIELTLHKDDVLHLEKLKLFLNTTRPIKNGNGDCKRLRFNSRLIRNRLVELGFTSNKSITIAPHDLLKDSRDFWRGVVDGDGGVYNYEHHTKQIFLCGTLETIFEFIFFCTKHGIKSKYPTQNKGKNLYSVSYYGNDANLVGNLLYKDATVYLDRKYKTYLEMTQEN